MFQPWRELWLLLRSSLSKNTSWCQVGNTVSWIKTDLQRFGGKITYLLAKFFHSAINFFPIQRQKAKKKAPKKRRGKLDFQEGQGFWRFFIKIIFQKKNQCYLSFFFFMYTFLLLSPFLAKKKFKFYSLMTWKKNNFSGKRRIAPPPPPGFESPVTRRRPASSSGRGRPSRRYSSEDSGIYISIYLFISQYTFF